MPKIGGVLVVLRPHGTHSERSHRSPDVSFPPVVTILHDVSRCSMSVGGALAPMRGEHAHQLTCKQHTVRRLHVVQNPHHWRCGGRRKDRTPGWSASKREIVRPARTKTPNLGHFKRAGRIFSRLDDHTTPQGEIFRAQMKPATPLLTPSRARMKPATPLLAHNAAKSSISREQRCHRFHPTTKTGPQRCQRFQPGIVLHRRGKQCTRAYTVARATRQCAYPRSAMPLRNAIRKVRPRPIIPHAIPTQPNPASTQNPQNSNDQTSNHETHSRELHAKLLDRQGQLHRNLAHNSIGRSFNKL